MRTLVAYDCSGSTHSCIAYHWKANKIVSPLPVSDTRVVLWNHRLTESSLAQLQHINSKREGSGGTRPYFVACALLSEREPCKLIVISDGQVDPKEVDRAEQEMRKVPLQNLIEVEVHLIGNKANMSVSCAFTRHAPSKVFVYNDMGELIPESCRTTSKEELELLDNLDSLLTIEAMEFNLPVIENAFSFRVMGTFGDGVLTQSLSRMRERVATTENFSDREKALDEKLAGLEEASKGAMRETFTVESAREAMAPRDKAWRARAAMAPRDKAWRARAAMAPRDKAWRAREAATPQFDSMATRSSPFGNEDLSESASQEAPLPSPNDEKKSRL
ncbi:hypothetical protein BASA81_005647 [Batrachochytrium salamandrivorans]|nr:hypothetical protein BASA81_005647 [Batrachochytrium salamandrivorans]